MDIELVNDKLLPLTWLHVKDEMPAVLTIQGGTVLPSSSGWRSELHHLLPMLPFQRLRRHLTVVCDHRGEHHFGPAELRSGNPVGYHEHVARVRGQVSLLVYPKVFRLAPPEIASRVPLGDHRAGLSLATGPESGARGARLPARRPAPTRRLAGDGTQHRSCWSGCSSRPTPCGSRFSPICGCHLASGRW